MQHLQKTRGGGAAMEFLKQNFNCVEIPTESWQPSSLQTDQRASAISGRALTSSSLSTDNRRLTTTPRKSRAMAVVGSGRDAHAAKLILVVFLVKDVPLLAAFEDFFLLRSDSLPHFQFNLLFVFQRGGQNLHHLLANGVAVVYELHFCAFDKHVRDLVREPYDFFARETHRFRKSSYGLEVDCVKPMMQVRRRPKQALRQPKKRLAKDQLAVSRQLLLHLFIHLLIRDAGPAHFVLVVDQNLPHFLVEPVLDRKLFQHALADAVGHGGGSLRFDLPALDQAFHNFCGHVRYKIPCEKHLRAFPLHQCKRVSLLAAPIKCKEGQGIAWKSPAEGARHAASLSANNSNIGEASANKTGSIRMRVDPSCRFLYDELGKGA